MNENALAITPENDSAILTSLYLEKLGHLQLELLEKGAFYLAFGGRGNQT